MNAPLVELVERVRTATGPDRELDHRIHGALGIVNADGYGAYPSYEAWVAASIANRWNAPAYTASIDAALALMERVLPGWFVSSIGEDFTFPPKARIGWTVELEKASTIEEGIIQGQAPTLPIAIILATLRALSSQEASK